MIHDTLEELIKAERIRLLSALREDDETRMDDINRRILKLENMIRMRKTTARHLKAVEQSSSRILVAAKVTS